LKNKALILLIILISIIAIAFFIIKQQYGIKVAEIGNIAPDIVLVDGNKNQIKLSDMKGSVVVLNFWATWCQSCIEELPSIENLFQQLSEDPRFKLVTILYRDDKDRGFRYMEEQGYTFPLFTTTDGSAAKKFGLTGVPETFIIDKKGILRDKVIGPAQWDSPATVASFRELMNEK
jgi:peroxiredoxin